MAVDVRCPYCGYSKSVPSDKIPPNTKWAICPKCRQRFELFHDVVFERVGGRQDSGATGDRGKSPWEMRDELGLWTALVRTTKLVLFSPDKMFGTLSYRGGMKDPLAFGLLTGSIGGMLGFFWQLMIMSMGTAAFAAPFLGHLGLWFVLIIMTVLVPILVLVGIYIYSAVLHFLLLIVRGGKNGFEATFRVICYSQVAQVIAIVPVLGGWVAGLWQLIIQIIGLKEIHETSYLRVIVAFLIPVAFIVLLVMAVLIPLVLHFIKAAHAPLGMWS